MDGRTFTAKTGPVIDGRSVRPGPAAQNKIQCIAARHYTL